MKVRHGRFGAFLGCVNYPECKGIVNIPKKGEEVISQDQLPACPAIGCTGQLVARKSRFGKTFYSCSTFPECDVIVNHIEDLETKYAHHPRTAYVKKASRFGGRRKKATAEASDEKPKPEKKKKAAAKKTTAERKKKSHG